MGHLKFRDTMPYPPTFWEKKKIELVHGYVEEIDSSDQKVRLASGTAFSYDKLVLATGSKSNTFGWPGEDLTGVLGLYNLQDLEKLEQLVPNASSAVIVGGGLIGIELGEMLHSRGIHVTFLIRECSYWNSVLPDEESQMINHVIRAENMEIVPSSLLAEILPDSTGRVRAIVTEDGREISCQIVGLTPGVHPNKTLAQAASIPTHKGILVNQYLETRIPNIYACGDCAEIQNEVEGSSRVESIWYTGKFQGETLARNLTGERVTYDPGIFYNSAKFLDLEYQVYGTVQKQNPDDTHYYWCSKNGLHSLRLVERGGALIGVNLMGIRYRHRTCEEWIKQKLSVKEVLPLLGEANFDPEFSKRFEPEIVAAFAEELR